MHTAGLTRRTLAQAVAVGVLMVAMGTLTAGEAMAATSSATSGSAAPSLHVTPDSANTCSDYVCIYVTGSGLNVSDWTTSAYLAQAQCSTASFLVDGQLWASGPRECGSADSDLVADWSDPGNFANGTVLCNTWSGIAGEACATVHS